MVELFIINVIKRVKMVGTSLIVYNKWCQTCEKSIPRKYKNGKDTCCIVCILIQQQYYHTLSVIFILTDGKENVYKKQDIYECLLS